MKSIDVYYDTLYTNYLVKNTDNKYVTYFVNLFEEHDNDYDFRSLLFKNYCKKQLRKAWESNWYNIVYRNYQTSTSSLVFIVANLISIIETEVTAKIWLNKTEMKKHYIENHKYHIDSIDFVISEIKEFLRCALQNMYQKKLIYRQIRRDRRTNKKVWDNDDIAF